SGLGTLNTLPVELVLAILEFLDFQSLSRLRCVSLTANHITKSVLAYTEVMTHAAGPLTVLAATGLLRYHSCFSLRQALRSWECVSCLHYGGFLFLFTCERACSRCLSRNLAFHVTKKAAAKYYFGVHEDDAVALPTLYCLPGVYPAGPELIAHARKKTV
ncbi:hypothetical protein BT67DRAFT_343891, partial [Trichocladium antarcticum]